MIGRTLSHYQIVEEISRGGIGVVYRAVDTRLNREVALKVLPPELVANAARRARFTQEAQATATSSASRYDHRMVSDGAAKLVAGAEGKRLTEGRRDRRQAEAGTEGSAEEKRLAVAAVRGLLSQELAVRLAAQARRRQNVKFDAHIGDPVHLKVERSSKVGHIKRLLVKTRYELLKRRPC